ncbi:DNA replication complex GINS protein PSF1-like [Tripterygium wilfordii]|uniref:DNA replication complex GINS protein PSF1-like n=1 Tax=Tripterygium wilfordii TaxID=458696 RepID=UPI0018F83C62|nr:DNA replication complex GINS protein PSF1-like [Tripterygium wilfordii]
MHGRQANQLVKELASSEKGQLKPFNSDLFDQVIEQCEQHHLELQSLIRKIQDEGLDVQTTRNADHYGALIHHLSLVRNKRCLLAYVYNRAEIIRSFIWKVGPVLPEEIQGKLSHTEGDHFRRYSAALNSYTQEVGVDLTVDMVPPKDPYIKVRVLDDIGEIVLSDKTANLARHSMHFLRRTDAEQYISQGLMEELTG